MADGQQQGHQEEEAAIEVPQLPILEQNDVEELAGINQAPGIPQESDVVGLANGHGEPNVIANYQLAGIANGFGGELNGVPNNQAGGGGLANGGFNEVDFIDDFLHILPNPTMGDTPK